MYLPIKRKETKVEDCPWEMGQQMLVMFPWQCTFLKKIAFRAPPPPPHPHPIPSRVKYWSIILFVSGLCGWKVQPVPLGRKHVDFRDTSFKSWRKSIKWYYFEWVVVFVERHTSKCKSLPQLFKWCTKQNIFGFPIWNKSTVQWYIPNLWKTGGNPDDFFSLFYACNSTFYLIFLIKKLANKIFYHYRKCTTPSANQPTTITEYELEGLQYLSGYIVRKISKKSLQGSEALKNIRRQHLITAARN